MLELYPLKFAPLFFEKIWGGSKIKSIDGLKNAPEGKVGEAWLLSGVENKQSVVTNGHWEGNELNEMVEIFMEDLVGQDNYTRFGNEFPILIKILDTTEWLSVQVHPDDEYAQKKHDLPFGKTEMWYILEAEEHAQLISGWSKNINRSDIEKRIQDGTLDQILQYHEVKPNDFLYTAAGTVHAIGPQMTLAEIQQTSDITYRLYDWNRPADPKNPRDLHIADSLEVMNFDKHDNPVNAVPSHDNSTLNIVNSEFFKVNHLSIGNGKSIDKDLDLIDSFVIYLCTKGAVEIICNNHVEFIKKGEVLLIPAKMESVKINSMGNNELLEIYSI